IASNLWHEIDQMSYDQPMAVRLADEFEPASFHLLDGAVVARDVVLSVCATVAAGLDANVTSGLGNGFRSESKPCEAAAVPRIGQKRRVRDPRQFVLVGGARRLEVAAQRRRDTG